MEIIALATTGMVLTSEGLWAGGALTASSVIGIGIGIVLRLPIEDCCCLWLSVELRSYKCEKKIQIWAL